MTRLYGVIDRLTTAEEVAMEVSSVYAWFELSVAHSSFAALATTEKVKMEIVVGA